MKQCPQCRLKYPSDANACFVDGTALVEIQDPRIGSTLSGRYEILEVLGEGGMATVYKAKHRLVDRICAVKIMSPAFAGNEVIRERFRREAKAAQKLAHPNIIEIFDQGDTGDGSLYLCMELLEGQSLASLLEREGKLPLERALPIMIQIARALARAHDLDVIHRDLKPENIFVARAADGSDLVKLLDFGIARSMQDSRLTGAGEVFGTPQYMAPERITSTEAGASSDLYAVGVIMYELVVGELPFDANDIATFFFKHLKEPPPRPRSKDPSIPEAVEKLILDLLAKDPADRPVDAHRVHADLLAIAGAIGIRPPAELAAGVESERGPAATLPPVGIDRWVRRTAVFEQMLQKAYPNGARPPDLVMLLDEVRRVVREVTELRSKSMILQRQLEAIETRGREMRQRFGHAVHAVGLDLSRARDELKAAQAHAAELAATSAVHRQSLQDQHRDIILWEGRCAFAEPWPELAQAYRTAAELLDAWGAVRAAMRAQEEEVAQRRTEVSDLEFQVNELRAALAAADENTERETAETQKSLGEMGGRTEELEGVLLERATRLCSPLRKRPELAGLFQELESEAAA